MKTITLEEAFTKQFGAPVGDGATVKLTEGSDTMLLSKSEVLEFITTYSEAVAMKRVEEERERMINLIPFMLLEQRPDRADIAFKYKIGEDYVQTLWIDPTSVNIAETIMKVINAANQAYTEMSQIALTPTDNKNKEI